MAQIQGTRTAWKRVLKQNLGHTFRLYIDKEQKNGLLHPLGKCIRWKNIQNKMYDSLGAYNTEIAWQCYVFAEDFWPHLVLWDSGHSDTL